MLIGCSFHLFFLSVSLWPVSRSLSVFFLCLFVRFSPFRFLSLTSVSPETLGRDYTLLSTVSLTLMVLFFSLLSVPPPPLICRPVDTLTFDLGSGAGRDDSRTCFSLWVYYLCSGPIKATPQSTSGSGCSGSQCGEFGSPPHTHPCLLSSSCPSRFPFLAPG